MASPLALQCLVTFASFGTIAAASQFPFEFLPASLPQQVRKLRGAPARSLEAAIPLDAAIALDISDGVERQPVFMNSPVADGPLRDLLDFGSALGTVVLAEDPDEPRQQNSERSAIEFGAPQKAVKSVIDALRVDMQSDFPAPLSFHNENGMVRIDGTLPKNLTARSLKAAFVGEDHRRLKIRYFLGKNDDADSVVAVEEKFDLDFSPTEEPRITYRASTGQFDLLVKRPVVKPSQQVQLPNEKSEKSTHETKQSAFTEDVLKNYMGSDRDFVQALRQSRLADLPELTRAFRQQVHKHGMKDSHARATAAAHEAKRFVSDVHLDDVRKVLKSAFEPLGTGLVMLEMRHSALPR